LGCFTGDVNLFSQFLSTAISFLLAVVAFEVHAAVAAFAELFPADLSAVVFLLPVAACCCPVVAGVVQNADLDYYPCLADRLFAVADPVFAELVWDLPVVVAACCFRFVSVADHVLFLYACV
jgi:hypothetical protein